MRNFLTFTFLLVLFTGGEVKASPSFDDEDYTRYRNSRFHFSILVPRFWQREVTELDYKHIVTFRKGRHGIIKITSTSADPEELRRYGTIRDWYIAGIGKRVSRIVETRNITINRGLTGRLYIVEFTRHRTRLLRRILISRYSDKILVIECGATIRQFYNYNDIFNNVMGSILITAKEMPPEEVKRDEPEEEAEQEEEKEEEVIEEKTEPVNKEEVKPVPPSEVKPVPPKKEVAPIEKKPEPIKKTEPADKKEPVKKEKKAETDKKEPEKPAEEKKDPVVKNETPDTPENVAPVEENPAAKKEFNNLDKLMEDY